MRKKDILELKKRFKKDHCTFTKMCGCYVNGEKNILLKFRETFLNLEEDDYFKYLEIAKKVLSGTIGNNILELNFELNEEHINEKQLSFMKLKNSGLKDDALLDEFYNSIIESYDYTGNFLILIFHDAYDIITKTKDNAKLDESEEVYEYILCAICPVELSKAGLRYFEDENAIITLEKSVLDSQIFVASMTIESDFLKQYDENDLRYNLYANTHISIGDKDNLVGGGPDIIKKIDENKATLVVSAYVGDTEIGENCNIGAGVITCNYDGANKFKTIIGNNVFVGSDTQLVAPVTVADGATIGAGSTITQNIEKDELVITRVPQRHIQGWQRPVKKK